MCPKRDQVCFQPEATDVRAEFNVSALRQILMGVAKILMKVRLSGDKSDWRKGDRV